MSQFFKMLFASIFGFFIALFLVFLLLIGIGMSIGSSISKTETVSVLPNSVLKINLNTLIDEQSNDNPLAKLTGESATVQGLSDIIKSIHFAKTDDKIKGIYLSMGLAPTSYANLYEIRVALNDFKTSGKFIYAYGDVVSQHGYYVASVADSVFLNPQGYFEFAGMSSQTMFILGMLEKLEIEPKIFYCGKYKSATESLRRKDMSPENEEQTMAYLNDIYNEIVKGIADSRHISTATVDSIADNLLIRKPIDALQLGFVDGLKYEDEVLNLLKEKTAVAKDKEVSFIPLNKYKNVENIDGITSLKDKIAVVYAEGNIVQGKSNNDLGSDDFVKIIRKIRKDPKIRAVVLRVNSPGGSALASDIMWRELVLLKNEKPLIVSMGTYAASGGYYISCMADTIVAEPTTITGSIGVFGVLPNFAKFFTNKLGITFDGVMTGKFSDLGNPNRAMTDEEGSIIQNSVNITYATFLERVAEGRGTDTATIHQIAQGRVWTGNQALANGLVDVLGTKDTAIKIAALKANITQYRVVEYPKVRDAITQLLDDLKGDQEAQALQSKLGPLYPFYLQMQQLQTYTGVQARLPFEVVIK